MSTFADIKTISKIHEGHDTVIYKGYRNSDHLPIAIKVPRSEYPSQRELAKLRHEYAILSKLKIPGVVKAYALEKYNNGLALIEEALNGQSIHALLQSQHLDIGTTLRIAIGLAGILGSVHDHNIIHKDIKPHNILFDTSTKAVHLIDFGIASQLSHETQQPINPNVLEGSLAYLSPEQTGRMNRSIDYRTDFYSLGVTIYEMLVHELPFTTVDHMELVHSHIARLPTPPCQRSKDIPHGLSDVVMKLLAKNAEDRYQSAYGLKADLEECLQRWESTGQIDPFLLGRQDKNSRLRISQKLYGRDDEQTLLRSIFERVRLGNAELLLVVGPSGIGKTALVNEIQKSLAYHGGYFLSGKFEQLSRNVPYRAIAQAFRELIHQILSERADQLGRWREKLQGALDINGRLLCEIIPELELIIGPQPPVIPAGPTEAENRFNMVFQSFVRVFCTAKHPLMLFMDDLQFADPASLKLLQVLASDPERHHFLMIGGYRDNELETGHQLLSILDELRKHATLITQVKLKPLQLQDVTALISDSLDSAPAHTEPLAQIVLAKTQGNPFFVGQFLGALYADKLLSFDLRSGEWRWDAAQLHDRVVTDNVVSFMLDKVQRLPASTRQMLELAACIGYVFDLQLLAITSQRAPEKTALDLWEALREGLVVPMNSEYRFMHSVEAEDLAVLAQVNVKVLYRFAHDRVRQAAYSLLSEERRRDVHLRIGRLLLLRHVDQPRDEALFDTVNHLNQGAALITDASERLQLAQLNLAAGMKAKLASAHAAAVEYLTAGMDLLDENSWESLYELSFALHVERLECEYLCGRHQEAESLFSAALTHARTILERVQIHNLRIVLYTTQSRFTDAVAAGRTALALMGVEVPEQPEQLQAAFLAELSAIPTNLAGRQIDELRDAAVMSDPEQQALIKLMVNLFAAAFAVNPALSLLMATKQVNTSLRHGNSELSAYGYATYGMILASVFGRYGEAFEFGRLAITLNEKFNNVSLQCKLANLYCSFIQFYRRPLREGLAYFERGNQVGQESGDFTYLALNCFQIVMSRLTIGEELRSVQQELLRLLTVMQRAREPLPTALMQICQQFILSLQGKTKEPCSLSSGQFEEGSFLAELHKPNTNLILAVYTFYTVKLQLYVLFEDHENAFAMALEAEKLAAFAGSSFIMIEATFFACLAAAQRSATADEAGQRRCQQMLEQYSGKLAIWAENCPENFRYKQQLVAAEVARLSGKTLEAMDLYDQAIASARSSDFVHHEALAYELAARFYHGLSRKSMAALYMGHAYHGYIRWGATAKTTQLAAKWGTLIASALHSNAEARSSSSGSGSVTTTSTRIVSVGTLDVATVFRAAQVIAGEIVLDKLLEQLMRIVLTNAGAQRVLLLIKRDEHLTVDAAITLDPDEVRVGMHAPLSSRGDVAKTILQYVVHTREPVVVDDAVHDKRFGGDPYVHTQRPQSILCLPLVLQGRLTGLLYLENNLAPHAFTAERVEVLVLLSAQAAIALENALLYQRVQSVTDSLRKSNDELTQANERLENVTLKLRDSNLELLKTNTRLQLELKERAQLEEQRAQAEQQRARLQEEIILVQRTRLAEMSTPLIPITDKIMVMPLIGTMDSQRAHQVLETALQGVQSNHTQVVIIDITGMKHVDTSVASTLISTAAALRLLGSEVVLTGIRAEVAQTLVSLGIDLGNIVTRSNLQGGIAYAVGRTGDSYTKKR